MSYPALIAEECELESNDSPTLAIPVFSDSGRERVLAKFRADFDTAYVSVAGFVAELGSSVERLVKGIEAFMNVHLPRLVESVVSKSRAMTNTCRSQAGCLLELMARFAGQLDIVMQSAGRIGGTLRKVGELSRGLHMVGMNALVATSNMGPTGIPTGVLANALTQLAADDIKVVGRLGQAADLLVRDARDLVTRRERLDGLLKEDFSSSELPIGDLFASLEGIVDDLALLISTASRIRGTTADIMLHLQRQDILRQGLDHVRLVLTTLREDGGRLLRRVEPANSQRRSEAITFLVFQDRAATLAAALLRDSVSELRTLSEQTTTGIDEMKSAVRALDDVRERIANGIRGKLHVPGAVFETFADHLSVQRDEVVRFREVVGSLSLVVERMETELSSLQQVKTELGAIRVLMRTETDRHGSWAEASAIIDDIHRGEIELQKFLDFNRDEAKALSSGLSSVVGISKQMYRHRERLLSLEEQLRQRPEELRHAGETFASGYEEVVRGAERLRERLSTTGAHLNKLSTGLDLLTEMADECVDLAAHSKSLVEKLSGGAPDNVAINPGKMADMIEALTVFSHKSMGAKIAGIEISEGDAAGTLTLF